MVRVTSQTHCRNMIFSGEGIVPEAVCAYRPGIKSNSQALPVDGIEVTEEDDRWDHLLAWWTHDKMIVVTAEGRQRLDEDWRSHAADQLDLADKLVVVRFIGNHRSSHREEMDGW